MIDKNTKVCYYMISYTKKQKLYMPQRVAEAPPQATAAPSPVGENWSAVFATAGMHDGGRDAGPGTHFINREGGVLGSQELGDLTLPEAAAARILLLNTVQLITSEQGARLDSGRLRAASRLGTLGLRVILPRSAYGPDGTWTKPQAHAGSLSHIPDRAARRPATEVPLTDFFRAPEEPRRVRAHSRTSRRGANLRPDDWIRTRDVGEGFGDGLFGRADQRTKPPIPEAKFSHKEAPQASPPQREYTPSFDLNFKDANFSPEATTKAQELLAKVARENPVAPGDALGRMRLAYKALQDAHPDRGGDTETAQVLSRLYQKEATPEARKAKAERRRAERAQNAERPTVEAAAPAAAETPSPAPQSPTPEAPAASPAT